MVFTLDELTSIRQANKLLKCKVLVIIPGNPGIMIGTDETVSYIKFIPYVSDKYSIWMTTKDQDYFTKSLSSAIDYIQQSSLSNQIDLDFNLQFNLLFIKIMQAYNKLLGLCSNPSSQYENIQLTAEFNKIINLPSSQGAVNYTIDNNHCVYLYQGLIPASKSDSISLYIYDINNEIFGCRFIVDKGKKGLINTYMLCKRI